MMRGDGRFVPLLVAVPLLIVLGLRGFLTAGAPEGLRTGTTLRVSAATHVPSVPAQAAPQARARATVDREINPDGFTSARVCGECHTEIYTSWRNSLHASSLSDPVFDAAFMQAVRVAGDGAREICLNCHAPIANENGDYAMREAITAEGVTCDFCHSVTAVNLDNLSRPYAVEAGPVKRSVLRNADSPVHEVAYSALHETAEFCGGCHRYFAPSGVALMNTYGEWLAGPYAGENIVCQDCHMALARGGPVDPAISDAHDQHHVHDLIRDRDQLRNALSVEIVSANRDGDSLDVEVAIENVGSGHMVPTGLPSRKIVLKVLVTGGSRDRSQERRYGKVIADARGKPLEADHEALLFGTQVINDNRLAPRERRIERMQFYAPGGALKVSATVSYFYAPMIMDVKTMNIEMAHAERYVR